MLAPYRAALRVPGAAAFCTAGFVMRLPIAIYPIGLVLIVSARTGRYGFAGLLAGTYVAANGVANPLLARLVDRYGQGRVLLPAAAGHAVAVAVLAVLLQAHARPWMLLAPTVVAGLGYLSVGSLVRARWSHVLADRPGLGTAYSLESTLDEVIFTAGPLLATLIATQLDPVLVLVLAVLLVSAGSAWLRALPGTEPPAHPAGSARHRSALRERGLVLLTATAVAAGAIFASAEVAMVAFCGQHGHRGVSGAVLACFAFGSGTAGFLYGSRTWRSSVLHRFRLQTVLFAALTLAFFAAGSIPVLAAAAFVAGLGIAPALITAFGLVEQIVPARSLTEGLAWFNTGLSVGYGLGSTLVGRVADSHGARAGFAVTVAAGMLMAALATLLHRRLAARAADPAGVLG